jgi:hypothetical protein
MKRRLILKGPEDAVIYRNLVFGFLSGNSNEKKEKEKIFQISRIKKAIFSCGDLTDVPLQVNNGDEEMLKFLNDSGTLVYKAGVAIYIKKGDNVMELYQNDWDCIEKHITAASWANIDCDVVAELFDKMSIAETIKEKE